MRYCLFAGLTSLALIPLAPAQTAVPPAALTTTTPADSQDQIPIIPHGLMGTKNFAMTLHAENGDTLKVESYRGRPILLMFWASWWRPSIETLGIIQNTARIEGDNGLVVFAVDRERQPGTAVDFLAQKHIYTQDFHYDAATADPKVREGLGGAPEFLLIDADGTVVYQNSPLFLKELHIAIRKVEQNIAHEDKPQKPPAIPFTDSAVLMGKAIEGQQAYTAQQVNAVCNYEVKSADMYPSGHARDMQQHENETFFMHGGQIESGKVNKDGSIERDQGFTSVEDTYKVWTSPLLPIIQQHSILSNEHRLHLQDGTMITIFTFRGNPNFVPKTDLERVAQSLQGEIRIDQTQSVFVVIQGVAAFDVVDDGRLILERGIPVLDYDASQFNQAYYPYAWSVAKFHPVSMKKSSFHAEWVTGLSRTFVKREGCQQYQVTSTVLPGYEAVPSAATPNVPPSK